MESIFLSDIELYYSKLIDLKSGLITINGEESNHIINVMRHKCNDEVHVTTGEGKIFKGQIVENSKKSLIVKIQIEYSYEERFPAITFCISKLRSAERFEYAIEKCTELGITNFIFFHADRAISKTFNKKRIEKIIISAMKQSLQCYLPIVKYVDSIKDIDLLPGEKIIFDQISTENFTSSICKKEKEYLLLFGPEGGFSTEELSVLNSSAKYKLADNRLRTETAIIKAASLL